MFEDTSFLKDAIASLRYQGIPVPAEAGKFINLTEFFKRELRQRGKLYEVNADFRGGIDYLDVVKSEIVCAIEDGDGVKKCKNINDCVGLVPSSLLKPI
jgi:hypothetical protein